MTNKLKPLYIGDLKINVPIIQGGMGVRVSTAPLAAAVAECGCAGTIASVGLGYGTEENETNFIQASIHGLQKEIRDSKKLTKGVVGVNIMMAASNNKDLARTASNGKVDFIASGAGLPMKLPEYVDDESIKLIPIVSSDRAANIIIKNWKKRYDRFPDAIIIEGPLAGGHLGFKPDFLKTDLNNILEQIVKDVLEITNQAEKDYNIYIPVIAGGGIFNGIDIARFIKLGASGVQIATRFVATKECSVDLKFKQLYLNATKESISIINSPVGMPGRALRTSFVEKILREARIPFKCNYQCLKTCNPKTAPYCIARAMFDACIGKIETGIFFAGSNVSRVNKIVSVKELINELVEEANFELKKN